MITQLDFKKSDIKRDRSFIFFRVFNDLSEYKHLWRSELNFYCSDETSRDECRNKVEFMIKKIEKISKGIVVYKRSGAVFTDIFVAIKTDKINSVFSFYVLSGAFNISD